MNSRQLTVFLAIVDAGGVGKAATRMHIAQPSLSQALRGMERELGVELFHRIGRRLVLSPAGRALVEPARLAVHALEQAEKAVADIRSLRGGTLDIASLATLATDPVAAMAGEFRRRHPDVTVRLEAPETADAVGGLVRSGRCELGFAHVPLREDDLVVRPLSVQRLAVVLPPAAGGAEPVGTGEPGGAEPVGTGEPGGAEPVGTGERVGAEDPVLGLRDLAGLDWVAAPVGTSTRTLLDEAMSALGVAPRIAVETPHRDAIVPLVLAGAGATLLPEALAEDAARRGAVLRRTDPPVTRRIAIVHRPGPLTPAAAAFLALAGEHPRG